MKSTIGIDVIGVFSRAIHRQNDFMKAADVFEESKYLGIHEKIDVITKDLDNTMENLHDNIKDAIEKQGGYILFVGVYNVDGKDYVDKNTYFKEGVRTVSIPDQGKLGWIPFSDMLKRLGYEVETDETFKVTKVN